LLSEDSSSKWQPGGSRNLYSALDRFPVFMEHPPHHWDIVAAEQISPMANPFKKTLKLIPCAPLNF